MSETEPEQYDPDDGEAAEELDGVEEAAADEGDEPDAEEAGGDADGDSDG